MAKVSTEAVGRRVALFRRHRNLLAAGAFLAPAVALIVFLRIVPVIGAVSQSMHQGVPGSLNPPPFVAGRVFSELFHSAAFWQSVRQTLIFNVIVNPLQIVLALLLAVLLSRGLPGTRLYRTLIFMPAAVPMAGCRSCGASPCNPVVRSTGSSRCCTCRRSRSLPAPTRSSAASS